MRSGQSFVYGCFYGNNCHIAWGIRSRLKEDIMNPDNERVYFYRYYKAVPRSQRQRSWKNVKDSWKFLNYPCVSIIIRNRFDRKHSFIIDFELRSNTPVQFYQGSIENNVQYVREVISCDRTKFERIGPSYLKPDESIEFFARPTFRMPKSTAGKSHQELKDEEKYLWMEFYRANVYVQPEV
jgi:hypothetical protein